MQFLLGLAFFWTFDMKARHNQLDKTRYQLIPYSKDKGIFSETANSEDHEQISLSK